MARQITLSTELSWQPELFRFYRIYRKFFEKLRIFDKFIEKKKFEKNGHSKLPTTVYSTSGEWGLGKQELIAEFTMHGSALSHAW
jgi:hypothetical protein